MAIDSNSIRKEPDVSPPSVFHSSKSEEGVKGVPSTETSTTIEMSPYQPIDSISSTPRDASYRLEDEELTHVKAQFPKLPAPDEDLTDPEPIVRETLVGPQKQEVDVFYNTFLDKKLEEFQKTPEAQQNPSLFSLLKTAIHEGKVSTEIAPLYIQITKAAQTATQIEFGLPTTWFKGTESIKDWTPIHLSAAEGTKIGQQQTKLLLNNTVALLQEMDTAAQKVSLNIPEGMISQADYFKIISDAIASLKEQLQLMQMQEAETSMKTVDVKKDQMEQQKIQADKQLEQMQKQRNNQGWLSIISGVMKWLGPVLAVGGFIATILTCGAAAPIVIAAAAMLAYSVVDSFCGVTQKIVSEVSKGIDKLMPNSPEWMKSIMKVALMVAAVVVIVVVSKGVGSIGGEAIKQVAKIVGLQAASMAIMASNAVPQLAADVVRAFGGNEMAANIVLFTAMLLQAGAVIFGSLAALKASAPKAPALPPPAQNISKTAAFINRCLASLKEHVGIEGLLKIKNMTIIALRIIPPSVQTGVGVANAVLLSQAAKITRESGDVTAEIELLKELIKSLENTLKQLQGVMEDREGNLESINDTFSSIVNTFKKSTDFSARFQG